MWALSLHRYMTSALNMSAFIAVTWVQNDLNGIPYESLYQTQESYWKVVNTRFWRYTEYFAKLRESIKEIRGLIVLYQKQNECTIISQ